MGSRRMKVSFAGQRSARRVKRRHPCRSTLGCFGGGSIHIHWDAGQVSDGDLLRVAAWCEWGLASMQWWVDCAEAQLVHSGLRVNGDGWPWDAAASEKVVRA